MNRKSIELFNVFTTRILCNYWEIQSGWSKVINIAHNIPDGNYYSVWQNLEHVIQIDPSWRQKGRKLDISDGIMPLNESDEEFSRTVKVLH